MTNQSGDPFDPAQQPQQPAGQQPQQQPAPPYGQQGYGYAPDHPKATTSLILGILGVVVCGVLAPFAWRMGKRTVAEIDASHGQLGGRGTAQAGYVLGLVGTILLGLALLFLVGMAVLFMVAAIGASTSSGY